MAKNEISDYDETNANNTDISGIAVSNSSLIAQIDDIVRAQMGALKRWFRSDLFRLRDSTDQTKLLAFGLSGLTTATTRTLAVPDKNGTIALLDDVDGYQTTATAAGTTTLTAASAAYQFFTGTTTQTVVLPVVSTLVLGKKFVIQNRSTGLVTVQSSGANTIQVMGGTLIAFAPGAPGAKLVLTCIAITGTGVASWDFEYIPPTTRWVLYTPTFTGFGTPTAIVVYSRRVGSNLEVRGRFTVGVPTATEARITLGFNGTSGGVTVDPALVSAIQVSGSGFPDSNGAVGYSLLAEPSLGYFTFGTQAGTTNALSKALASNVLSTGLSFSFTASVPLLNG